MVSIPSTGPRKVVFSIIFFKKMVTGSGPSKTKTKQRSSGFYTEMYQTVDQNWEPRGGQRTAVFFCFGVWGALGTKIVQRAAQRASETPPDGDLKPYFLYFCTQRASETPPDSDLRLYFFYFCGLFGVRSECCDLTQAPSNPEDPIARSRFDFTSPLFHRDM